MIDSQEMVRRRRMVYHALRDQLDDANVRRAVELCDTEFSQEAVFSLHRFVDRLGKADPSLAAQSGSIFKSLLAARTVPVHDLAPDPAGEAASAPSSITGLREIARPIPSQPATTTGWAVVFNRLLAELTGQIDKTNPRLFERLGSQLPPMISALRNPASRSLADWLASKLPQFTDATSRAEMHSIAHGLYLWCCEEFGPVGTDRIFSRALRSCDELPEAIHHPPRGLL